MSTDTPHRPDYSATIKDRINRFEQHIYATHKAALADNLLAAFQALDVDLLHREARSAVKAFEAFCLQNPVVGAEAFVKEFVADRKKKLTDLERKNVYQDDMIEDDD